MLLTRKEKEISKVKSDLHANHRHTLNKHKIQQRNQPELVIFSPKESMHIVNTYIEQTYGLMVSQSQAHTAEIK